MNRSAIIKMLADEFSQQIDGLSDEQLSRIAAGDDISINFQGCRNVPLDFAGGKGMPPRPVATPAGAPPAPPSADGGGGGDAPTQAGGHDAGKPAPTSGGGGGGKPAPTGGGGKPAPTGGHPAKGGGVPLPPKR